MTIPVINYNVERKMYGNDFSNNTKMTRLSVEAVIFDADGVIFDSEKLWDIGDGHFMAKRGIKKIDDTVKVKLAGTSLHAGTQLLLSSHGIQEDIQKASAERMKIMEDLYSSNIEFMNGFPEFFNWLNIKGIKSAVATSMNKSLFPPIDKRTGFLKKFDHQVFSVSDVENAKPAPDIYLFAAKNIQVNPDKCLVIEDAPNGIKAAKSAGMFCIGLSTTFKPTYLTEADIICNSFTEIREFITLKI